MVPRKFGVCGEFGWVRFLVVTRYISYIRLIPTHDKIFAVGKKSGRIASFNLIFLGLG